MRTACRSMDFCTSSRCLSQHREKGQAIVEFALIMPILIILLLGVVFYAMAFNLQMVLNAAAREGARAWASKRTGTNPCCANCLPPCNPLSSDNDFKKNIAPLVRKYVADNGYNSENVIFPDIQIYSSDKSATEWQQIPDGDSAEDATKVKLVITYGIRLPTSGVNFITLKAESTFKRGS